MSDDDGEPVSETSDSSSGSDRRRRRRVHISSTVAVKDVTHLMTGAGADVSLGGLYLLTTHEIDTGTILNLTFTIDEIDHDFAVQGVVRWRLSQPVGEEERYGLGIEFLNLDPEDREALEQFVADHETLDASDAPGAEEPESEEERRDTGRVPISARVTMKTAANLTTASGSDLSVNGIYIVTPDPYEVGSYIDLEFTLGGFDKPFEVLGEVKWQQPHSVGDSQRYGLGIEFAHLDPRDRERLEEFTRKRAPLDPEERLRELREND